MTETLSQQYSLREHCGIYIHVQVCLFWTSSTVTVCCSWKQPACSASHCSDSLFQMRILQIQGSQKMENVLARSGFEMSWRLQVKASQYTACSWGQERCAEEQACYCTWWNSLLLCFRLARARQWGTSLPYFRGNILSRFIFSGGRLLESDAQLNRNDWERHWDKLKRQFCCWRVECMTSRYSEMLMQILWSKETQKQAAHTDT